MVICMEASDSGTSADTDSNIGIVQEGINELIELYIQPHQIKVPSGGGVEEAKTGWVQ